MRMLISTQLVCGVKFCRRGKQQSNMTWIEIVISVLNINIFSHII